MADIFGRLWPRGSGAPHEEPWTPDERHNSRIMTVEALSNGMVGAAVSFFALFAMQLGASNTLVGWLTAGPALLTLLWVLPCGQLIQRSRRYNTPIVVAVSFNRLLMILMAGVPLLPASWRTLAVAGIVTLLALPNTVWNVGFWPVFSDMVPPHRVGQAVGRRWTVFYAINVVATYLLGKLLDNLPFPANFQGMFIGVGIWGLSTVFLLSRLRLPSHTPPARTSSGLLGRALWRELRQHPAFLLYELCVLVAYTSIMGATPLFRIYWVRDLGAGAEWVGALTALLSVGAVAGSAYWGRHPYLRSRRELGFIVTAGTMALYALLTAAFRDLRPLLGVMLLAGFFTPGNEIFLQSRTLSLSPEERRPTFVSIHNMVANVAGFIGPLLGTALAGAVSTRVALVLMGVLGLIGAGMIWALGWGERTVVQTEPAP